MPSRAAHVEDEAVRVAAMKAKAGVLNIEPFKTFFDAFSTRKIPAPTPFKEFLVKHAGVPGAHVEDCMEHILADAHGGTHATYEGWCRVCRPRRRTGRRRRFQRHRRGRDRRADPRAARQDAGRVKIPAKLAEDEPNRGRPISEKVAGTMCECGAGIIVFTPDVELQDMAGNPIWMPSDNVVHELGAASMEYGKRIVVFREERVTLASNYSDIGHIVFKEGELSAKAIELFRELVDFGLIQFTVPE